MKHVKKIATYAAIGGFGAIVAAGLAGCGDSEQNGSETLKEAAQKTGAFVIIEETAPGKYKVLEEYPSSEEMDKLVAEENAKIDAGTSNLTNPSAQISSGGMSLGETLLASAAGAIIGSWIGNKLFNNQNFQAQRQNSYKNPTTYSRSVDSFNKAKQSSASSPKGNTRSGFFGGSGGSSSSSSSSSSYGG